MSGIFLYRAPWPANHPSLGDKPRGYRWMTTNDRGIWCTSWAEFWNKFSCRSKLAWTRSPTARPHITYIIIVCIYINICANMLFISVYEICDDSCLFVSIWSAWSIMKPCFTNRTWRFVTEDQQVSSQPCELNVSFMDSFFLKKLGFFFRLCYAMLRCYSCA